MLKRLHYDKHLNSTSSQWMVFLHGAGGSIATWKQQIKEFKDRYNLLAFDLRDHGRSKNVIPSYEQYNFDIVVSDIQQVLNDLNITKAHFVTLSFGSVLMQAIYKRHASKVQSMTLIGGIFNANWMIKAFIHSARFLNLFLPYRMMYRIFSFLLMPKKHHQVARKVYQMQARKLSQSEYLKWLGLYGEFFTLLRSFHHQNIKTPTLILMGEEDYLFLPSARTFTSSHTNTQLQIIPQAGHICNIEKPKEVNKVIFNFLSNLPGSEEKQPTKFQYETS